jgi:methyl-accepting chemotaxis protein
MSLAIMAVALIFFVSAYVSITRKIKRGGEETVSRLSENDAKLVDRQIAALGDNVGSYLTAIEDEIDKRMLNAAIALQISLLPRFVSDRELAELAGKVGMDDLYIAGIDGVFTQSTEKAAMGVSLFDIWDGYRMLTDGRAEVLPSAIKVKEETGEIFKFTAIPRVNMNGDVVGVLEAALDASTSVGLVFQGQIENNPQLNFINLVESTGLVLTANGRQGGKPPFKVSDKITDSEILNVAASDKPLLRWASDGKSVVYCKPIKRFGAPAYVLYIDVNPTSYLENTEFVKSQFNILESGYDSGMMIVLCVSGALILSVIALYMFFIRLGMLRPLGELSAVMSDISGGSGDLTGRLIVRGNDEIGSLAGKFNEFIEGIMNTVSEAKNAIDVVTDGSSEVVGNIGASYSGVKNVSDQVKNLSENIQKQVRGIDGCEEISEQLARDCEYLSSQISEAVDAMERIISNKNNGEGKISSLTESNKLGIEKNRKTAGDISDLNAHIADINNIVDEIKRIAKQTQLLSLNASIEAASAGEHGKGFAVVAGEVKGLAEQSAASALKIETIIDSIGRSSASSVEAVTEVMRMAEEQDSYVGEVRETFSGISAEVEGMRAIFGNVNKSLDAVASVSEKMRGEMRGLREIGIENTHSVESVDESMGSQVNAMENIKRLSDRTTSTIGDLEGTLGRFRVR